MMYFKCSEKNNKMEVMFIDNSVIHDKLMSETKYKELKASIPKDKTMLYITDEDINSTFIIYL